MALQEEAVRVAGTAALSAASAEVQQRPPRFKEEQGETLLHEGDPSRGRAVWCARVIEHGGGRVASVPVEDGRPVASLDEAAKAVRIELTDL